ncbi:hypothetical protein PFISCL1PPCAC_1604, partial [Pristionchus fissidentatus]
FRIGFRRAQFFGRIVQNQEKARALLTGVPPLNADQQAILNRLTSKSSFSIFSHYDKLIEVSLIANDFEDAVNLLDLDRDQTEILSSLTNLDSRVPYLIECEILADLSKIDDEEERLRVCSEYKDKLEKASINDVNGQTIWDHRKVALSLQKALDYTNADLIILHRR